MPVVFHGFKMTYISDHFKSTTDTTVINLRFVLVSKIHCLGNPLCFFSNDQLLYIILIGIFWLNPNTLLALTTWPFPWLLHVKVKGLGVLYLVWTELNGEVLGVCDHKQNFVWEAYFKLKCCGKTTWMLCKITGKMASHQVKEEFKWKYFLW